MGARSDKVEQIRRSVEKTFRTFVSGQIDTALTLAESAETLFRSGSTEHATEVQTKAWQAYDRAVAALKDVSLGRTLERKLQIRVDRVRDVLDALPAPDGDLINRTDNPPAIALPHPLPRK